ncbi:MAG: hypothetical protein SPD11_06900 [Sphaerochaetaceae bacterium]|nr:hypothetical protein [Sphaerochaetaceae bacterium]
MSSWLKDFQAHNRVMRQDEIDTAVFENTGDNILKAASAMLEAKVKKDKVKELLIKYWDIRPSDADFFIEKAEEGQT